MPDITSYNGIDMADIASINGQDVAGGDATASTTPTGSISFGFGLGAITISNHGDYTNPNYQVSVSLGGSEIVADSAIDHVIDADGSSVGDTITFTDTNAGTGERTITIRAQEFGADTVQSAALTLTYTPSYAAYRYIRLTNVNADKGTSGTSWLAVNDWELWTGAGLSGTLYPENHLTSDTSETGIALDSLNVYSTYEKWKAFDSNATGTRFWSVSGNPKTLIIEFEPGTYSPAPIIKSMKIIFQYAFWALIEGSDNGSDWTEIIHTGPVHPTSQNAGGTLTLG